MALQFKIVPAHVLTTKDYHYSSDCQSFSTKSQVVVVVLVLIVVKVFYALGRGEAMTGKIESLPPFFYRLTTSDGLI